MSEDEKEEIPIEVAYDALRAAAIVSFFEKEFEEMPHPLRIFKFRRWVNNFEIFLKGVAFGEMLTKKLKLETLQSHEKRKTIEIMEEDEGRD